MNPNARLHPQRNELEAFVSGLVPDESAAAISEHLAECEPCRTVVDSLPPDTLLSLLKQAPGSGSAETSPAGG